MFKVNVNAAKAEAMGVALSDINQTISTAFGSSYVNDFLNQGRVKKVYVEAGTPFRMLPDNINQWYVRNASGTMAPLSAYSSTEWTYGSPRLERYNGIPSMDLGEAAAGKSTSDAMKFMGNDRLSFRQASATHGPDYRIGSVILKSGSCAVCDFTGRGCSSPSPHSAAGQFRSR